MYPESGVCVVNSTHVVVDNDGCDVWTTRKNEEEVKIYAYEEAVDLTGHGAYSLLLLVACCLSLLGLIMDMLAIGTYSSIAACDLNLGTREEQILMSVPFLGTILTVYFWGYISDTQGRRKVMLVSMWASFCASCLAALSSHWIIITAMKLISVGFSGSMQSIAYALIGESCGTKVKSVYYFILTSVIHIMNPIQTSLHYYTLTLNFSIELGFVTFVPWRFLAIALALPLGASAVCFHFIYESPKFLANAGREDEALEILAKIWKRNRQPRKNYPVKKIILGEDSYIRPSGVNILQSLWNQTAPLFKQPLLFSTMRLFLLSVVIYSAPGGLFNWFAFLTDAYIKGSDVNHTSSVPPPQGLCNMITQYEMMKESGNSVSCIPKSNMVTVWATAVQGLVFVTINCSMAFMANRRKLIMIVIMVICTLAALGCATLDSNAVSLFGFFTIFSTIICTGIVFSYYVDLYPTSYRGMASCLGLMMARVTSIASINLVGSLIMDHCNATFFLMAATLFGGVIVSCILPPDQIKKSK